MIKTNCIHFPLDRPCKNHKETGIHCTQCNDFQPFYTPGTTKKILIVKLGAMGDVLRTTFLLPGLKEKYPKSEITWIVGSSSVPILQGNPYITHIWPFSADTIARLAVSAFDIVVNLDLAPDSINLATAAFAKKKIGFQLTGKRTIASSNTYAAKWLFMSAFDDKKKQNNKTYQYWMAKICGLPKTNYEIYTPLIAASLKKAKAFMKQHGLRPASTVGINPGAGKRWKLKKWTDDGYRALIERLFAIGKQVILLGGPEEKELIDDLVRQTGNKAISTGTDNSLPDFFALVNCCNLIITGDTLCLHAALGLKKKVAVIFGPTSAAEIELYGRGRKIISPADCVCCYRTGCSVQPDCMQRISIDTVWNTVSHLLKK